jgi:hypothetical protein
MNNPLSPDDIDVRGPLFLSYRQCDGTKTVSKLGWLLRSAGIPVWRDVDDLPPGDTADRLEQALADGLSGGVLVITPDIANSPIVRSIEAPALIRMFRSDDRFQLLVANAIERSPGKVDYSAPDKLLERVRRELEGVNQNPVSDDGLFKIVQAAVAHRMAQHRAIVEANGFFELTVQTRNIAQVYDRTGAQLDVRVRRSSHERLPSADGLEDLRRAVTLLPDAVVTTGARNVRISGGGHVSVGFALGAALPSSRVGSITVIDQRDAEWASTTEAAVPIVPQLTFDAVDAESTVEGRPRVVAYVDLLPTPSDAAPLRFLSDHAGKYVASATVAYEGAGLLNHTDAGSIAAEAMARVRELSAQHGNAAVDLLLRCPFPLSVLMGRLSNTLRIRLYEWDDSELDGDFIPRYVAALVVHASSPGGPITAALLPIVRDEADATTGGGTDDA